MADACDAYNESSDARPFPAPGRTWCVSHRFTRRVAGWVGGCCGLLGPAGTIKFRVFWEWVMQPPYPDLKAFESVCFNIYEATEKFTSRIGWFVYETMTKHQLTSVVFLDELLTVFRAVHPQMAIGILNTPER